MAENRPTEETVNGHCGHSRMPHVLLSIESRQIQESPNDIRYTLASINPRTAFNCDVRTAERSRIFVNNISSTIREIHPLIQQTAPNISLTSLLTIHRLRNQVHSVVLPSDSYVINVEEPVTNNAGSHDEPVRNYHHHVGLTMSNNFSSNTHEAANEIDENYDNNDASENTSRNVRISPEIRAMLKQFQQYIIFGLIVLAKGLYDYLIEIFAMIVLFTTFIYANNGLKREVANQHNRSWLMLIMILWYVITCIVSLEYLFKIFELYTGTPSAKPLTVIWDMLFYVIVMDFMFKLYTIICKILLTCLPKRLLAFQNRGKYYHMIEATSQLFRCVATVEPWLYYLIEMYQGPEKIIGIFFSIFYTISKSCDIFSRLKLFCTAAWKMVTNVNPIIGPPSKEELIASGGICVICHEEYTTPVRLHCKHIFCEMCVTTWLNRERSCPLCRASITDGSIYWDGHTTHYIQLH